MPLVHHHSQSAGPPVSAQGGWRADTDTGRRVPQDFIFYNNLKASGHLTTDPALADYFFFPVGNFCMTRIICMGSKYRGGGGGSCLGALGGASDLDPEFRV